MSLNSSYHYNPYTPTFGMPPRAYIHRYDEENKILNEFCVPDGVPGSYMIIGARGVGKTVLMHEMANRFETFPEWVVVRMNPNMDMMTSLINKLSGHKKLSSIIKSASLNLSFFGLSIDMASSPIRDAEDAITEILKNMDKYGKRLLIIVDEATNTDSMKAFASSYQNLIGQKLPVYLLMTGLYENINTLKNVKNLTFLYRMPRILLTSLKLDDIADNYKEVFLLDDEEAFRMANYTKGYSYAFQLLGKLSWDHNGEYTDILENYRQDLYEMVYEKIWEEMSDMDKEFVYGIAKSKNGKIKDIRSILDWEANAVSPYRDRLIKKGVIYNSKYGYLDIVLPYFKGFVLNHYTGRMRLDDLPEDL